MSGDSGGNIVVVESANDDIDVFPPGATTPSVTVTLSAADHLAQLAMQNSETMLWVSSEAGDVYSMPYQLTPSTVATEYESIAGGGNGIAVTPTSRGYVRRMAQAVETLIRENMHGVFGEHDAQKRRTKIASLWAEDGVFIDPEARYEGHSGIERAATGLIEKSPTFSLQNAAKSSHTTESEGSLGDTVPPERRRSSPALTCL